MTGRVGGGGGNDGPAKVDPATGDAINGLNPVEIPYPVHNYDFRSMISSNMTNSSADLLRARMGDYISATGMSIATLDFTWGKAIETAKALALDPTIVKGMANLEVVGHKLGVIGLALDVGGLVVGLSDGQITKADWVNAAQVALGVSGLVAGGWLAVGFGGLSIAVAYWGLKID